MICRRKICSVLFLLAVFCCGTLLADRVELKTGEVFFGKILRANRREVSMRLESGGILSFRMIQVGFFRKNFVASDEWISSPVLLVDDPTSDNYGSVDPVDDTSFQSSPSTPVDTQEPVGIALGPTADIDLSLVRPPVEAPQGFRVSPPRVFLDWEKPGGSSVKRFYDPVTQASLDIVDLGPKKGSLASIKTETARAHAADATTGLEVLQDQPVRDAPYEGWYFKFQQMVDGGSNDQIWLFVKGRNKVVVLKYSCPAKHFEAFRRSFAESIRSFSPTETQDVEPSITPPEEEVGEAEDLLRLLRRKSENRETSWKANDEYRKQDAAGDR